jgi:quinol monooxygenase YgiN
VIIVVASVRVHPDKVAIYEAACRGAMPRIRAANPGILFYHLGKSRDAPHSYRVVEAYRDEEAMEAHVGSELLKESFGQLQDYIAELTIEITDSVV